MTKIIAPFTNAQVVALNHFQTCGIRHPFTCAKCGSDLIATTDGWRCSTPGCPYTQDWAHDFMCTYDN